MDRICGPPGAHQNTGSSAGSVTGKGGPHWERRAPPRKDGPTKKGGPHQERRTPSGSHRPSPTHDSFKAPSHVQTHVQYGSEIQQQRGAETEVSHCLDKVTSDCALQTHIINEEQWKTCEAPPPKVKPCHVGLGMVAYSYDPSTWKADSERLGILVPVTRRGQGQSKLD